MLLKLILLVTLCLSSGCSLFADIPRSEVEAKYARTEDGSQFIEVLGMRVHYRDQGDAHAPALLMFHGIADSLHTWDHWANVLKESYRVIRVDVPGFGLTDHVSEVNFTPEFYIEFILALHEALKINSAIVIGNSLGGYLAWNWALYAPKKVIALVLLDPAAYPLTPPWIVRIASTPLRYIAEIYSPRWITAKIAREVFADDNKVSDEIIERYHTMLKLEGARKRYMDVFASINRFAKMSPQHIEKITQPVLLLWGEKDRWITIDQLELWKRDVKNVTGIAYPGVGHVPQEEIPQESLADALSFIRKYY